MVLPVVTRGMLSVIVNSPFGLLNSLIAFHLQLEMSYHKARCNRRLEGSLGLRLISNIQRDSTNFLGVPVPKLDKLLRIAGCRDHAISCLKHRFCERAAEAARSTGNEPHL
jgi:hypothetical protein